MKTARHCTVLEQSEPASETNPTGSSIISREDTYAAARGEMADRRFRLADRESPNVLRARIVVLRRRTLAARCESGVAGCGVAYLAATNIVTTLAPAAHFRGTKNA